MKTRFPARPVSIALVATLLVWGAGLSPKTTWSPEGLVSTIAPWCRVGTPELSCQMPLGPVRIEDAGAPAWQNIPSEYFFRHARLRGEPRPNWNPYIGSGYPIVLDGHNSALSLTQRFLTYVPGDQGHDIVVFTRFALWTIGITWLVSLFGNGIAVLACVALTAAIAPYGASYVDIAFLDADLLSPWFVLILVAYASGRLQLGAAGAASFVLGLLVGAAPFPQAAFALCFAMGVVSLASAPFTRGRSLVLGACLAIGILAVFPSWLPLARNLDQFVSSRKVQCIAQSGIGSFAFFDHLRRPQLVTDRFVFVTLMGIGLLLFLPKRAWFLGISLAVLGAWEVYGLPHAACNLPVVSGVRFVRHLLPHLEVLFVATAGIAIFVLSRQLEYRRAWGALAAGVVVLLYTVKHAVPTAAVEFAWSCFWVATTLGVLAALLHFPRLPESVWKSRGARVSFGIALALVTFTPFVFASTLPIQLLQGVAGAPQMPPLPDTIDEATPLGAVAQISKREDRRHFSPSGFLFPNWGQALGIPEMLVLYALYPVGYHELNGGLYNGWYHDPQHGLIPDRFVNVGPEAAMQPSFQRILVLHRISLFTFTRGQARFAAAPSPYERAKCQLLASSRAQRTESYKCPEVGGIGFFPSTVGIVNSREQGVEVLRRLSPQKLVTTALLGPELDDALAGTPASAEALVGAGTVRSVRRWGDDLTYTLDVERAGTFVIAETFFRGWRASVNGRRVPISRANVNFKAVQVPAGEVRLKLHFKPLMFGSAP